MIVLDIVKKRSRSSRGKSTICHGKYTTKKGEQTQFPINGTRDHPGFPKPEMSSFQKLIKYTRYA